MLRYIRRFDMILADGSTLVQEIPSEKHFAALEQIHKWLLLSVISTQTPEEAGLGVFANWTAALACAFVERKFGISYSSRGMLNLFDRLGLSYTRPTYTLDKAAPKKQEQFRKTFET